MIYLAANNSRVRSLRAGGWPLGWIMSPDGWRLPKGLPFALDNGLFYPYGGIPKGMKAYPPFYSMLGKVAACGEEPLFVVVPDAPYDAEGTRMLYTKHQRHIRENLPGVRCAMAVQDGMDENDLDMIEPPGAVFVAGSTEWKWATMERWVRAAHDRDMWAHVARVNTKRRIAQCIDAGADSADGSGVFRGDKAQLAGVLASLVQPTLYGSDKHPAAFYMDASIDTEEKP